MNKQVVYLLPSVLADDGYNAIPPYIIDAVKNCQVFFVENERTARRYLKKILKEIVIDDHEWFPIPKEKSDIGNSFRKKLSEGKIIGVISEAGCPGIADPGQELVSIAQSMNVDVKPLVGPNSIILALMASGMNGQHFRFIGYLPVNDPERSKAIKEMENESSRRNCTQVFIETPYRNNQLIEALIKNCNARTKLCIAVDLTGSTEWVKTKTLAKWKEELPDIHKRPAIFCLMAFQEKG